MNETERNEQLFVAIRENDVNLAKELLAEGTNVYTIIEPELYKDTDVGIASYFRDVTPLHFAVIKGNKEMVETLLDKEAKINAAMSFCESGSRTPLHLAVDSGNTEITELLLKRKAEVDARVIDDCGEGCLSTGDGCTPLHCALAIGDLAMAELLLKYGANVNAKVKGNVLGAKGINFADSYTALHIAVYKGNLRIVELLLEKNADVNAKDKLGNTPLQLAIKQGKTEIATLIKKHIAKKKIEKKIFLHNHKPLIDALLKLGYNGDNTPNGIKTFLEENKDEFKIKLGVKDKTLIDFVDSKDVAERHTPALQLHAAVSVVVQNVNSNLNKPNTEQHQARQQNSDPNPQATKISRLNSTSNRQLSVAEDIRTTVVTSEGDPQSEEEPIMANLFVSDTTNRETPTTDHVEQPQPEVPLCDPVVSSEDKNKNGGIRSEVWQR